VSEYDALDAMVERMAREEQDDIERNQGEAILEMLTAGRQERDKELSKLFNEAWRASLASAPAKPEG
jgi:hypothetical protein